MRIATFNVNNINKRLANLLAWLAAERPDVVCLQELKAADGDFPREAIEDAGYGAVWRGQKSWNGVAILARGKQPVETHRSLPGDEGDTQARYIAAAVNGVLIASLYAPNGNPQPGPKFDYKLAWMKRLEAHAAELHAANLPVVLAGDFNVVPTEQDIYRTSSYKQNALVQPEPRLLFRRILDQGWVDAIRTLHPDEPMFTFWDYMRNRWERNAGLRLDHLLLSPEAAERLTDAGVDREMRGEPNASDHAPAWIVLGEPQKRHRSTVKPKAKPAPRKGARDRVAAPDPGRRPLLAIDGDSFAHRAYHALPKAIATQDGRPRGAVLGFANFLLKFYREAEPRAVIVAWDTLEAPTYRHKAYPDYQSGREFDAAILEQLAILPDFVSACGFVNAKTAGYEADDFLAAAVAAESRRGGTALVASGDRDSFQLASETATILFPVRAGEIARIGPEEVRARYGVEPAQVPDFIALRGDPSDKLPGLPGIGAAGAASLLRKYGSLDAMLEAGKFAPHAGRLRLYRQIATMDATAPLPRLTARRPTWARAAKMARSWSLSQLAERLEALAGTG